MLIKLIFYFLCVIIMELWIKKATCAKTPKWIRRILFCGLFFLFALSVFLLLFYMIVSEEPLIKRALAGIMAVVLIIFLIVQIRKYFKK